MAQPPFHVLADGVGDEGGFKVRVCRPPAEVADIGNILDALGVPRPVLTQFFPDSREQDRALLLTWFFAEDATLARFTLDRMVTSGGQMSAKFWTPPGYDPIRDDYRLAWRRFAL